MKKTAQIGMMITWVSVAAFRLPWAHNLIWSPEPEAYPNRITALGKWSYPIVIPAEIEPDDPRYVTLVPGEVSLFVTALGDYRSYGILAHNFLAGVDFDQIESGDYLRLDFPDGKERWFHAYQIIRAPKIYPPRPPDQETGLFIPPLDVMGAELTQRQAYEFIYGHMGYLILQTCIGDQNGFIFVMAEPIERPFYLLQGNLYRKATLPAAGGGARLLWSAPRPEDLGIYDG